MFHHVNTQCHDKNGVLGCQEFVLCIYFHPTTSFPARTIPYLIPKRLPKIERHRQTGPQWIKLKINGFFQIAAMIASYISLWVGRQDPSLVHVLENCNTTLFLRNWSSFCPNSYYWPKLFQYSDLKFIHEINQKQAYLSF